ncbi:MAG: isoaspartyl peptidase/L-asparaginase [Candidatus Zixiibacteriota bacterium]|nr:MAG: isoaspartyl peptidase/L-asparaginase [candidate division Zixibacteria bacterium]
MGDKKFGIVIHGGAGTILKSKMTPEKEAEYRQKLGESLQVGYDIVEKGGAAIDATQAAVKVMEDSPLFNAGKGAVFTHEGLNEQDACIMDGKTLNSGAVAGVRRIKNPIELARLVMDKSEHILLSGEGAEAFAQMHGIEFAEAEYFYTEHRWKQLRAAKYQEKVTKADYSQLDHSDDKHGTVGAVALDRQGNLAAATSSGGMTNKKFGRLGDSPIVGAGNYANNRTCAVSGTGHGEYFITAVVSYDVSALMEYKGLSLQQAANMVIYEKLAGLGGTGGLIAIDRDGNVAMPFNTEGMYRGNLLPGQKPVIEIFKE